MSRRGTSSCSYLGTDAIGLPDGYILRFYIGDHAIIAMGEFTITR